MRITNVKYQISACVIDVNELIKQIIVEQIP